MRLSHHHLTNISKKADVSDLVIPENRLDSNDGVAVGQRILLSGVRTFLVDDDDVVCEVDSSQQQIIQTAAAAHQQPSAATTRERQRGRRRQRHVTHTATSETLVRHRLGGRAAYIGCRPGPQTRVSLTAKQPQAQSQPAV